MSAIRACVKRLLASGACLVLMSPVYAEADSADNVPAEQPTEGPANELSEVVVTSARKRNEASQDAPLAITAVSGDTLEREHVSGLEQLQTLSPNLHIHRIQGGSDTLGVYLRGFGINTQDPGTNPAVSMFIDGIYQSQANGSQIDFFDIDAIEVLKGPQGTVLGKNSPAGAISIRTKRPTGEFDASAQVNYERFNRKEVRAALDAPLVPGVLAARLSLLWKDGGNYQDVYGASDFQINPATNTLVLSPGAQPRRNATGGDDVKAARLGLLFTPTTDINWYVSLFGSENRSPFLPGRPIATPNGAEITPISYPTTLPPPGTCAVFLYCTPFPRYSSGANYLADHHINIYSVTSDLNVRLGAVTLSSLTGYKNYDGDVNNDIDGTPATVLNIHDSALRVKEYSQEFRLSSADHGGLDLDGRLNWMLGLYYFRNQYNFAFPLTIYGGALNVDQNVNAVNQSYAIFAQTEYEFIDTWKLAFGARQTWDKRKQDSVTGLADALPPRVYASADWDNLSVESTLTKEFDPNKRAFVRFAEGYRGGGMQSFPGAATDPGLIYNPEKVKAYELGFKADWLDHTLRTNVSAFYNRYSNLQRSLGLVNNGVISVITQNAAKAETKGVELETIMVPMSRLTLKASVGYLDAKYLSYQGDVVGAGVSTNNSNFRFPHAPHLTADFSAEYRLADGPWGAVTVAADDSWVGAQSLQISDIPVGQQAGYNLTNASVRYDDPSGHYSVTAYGRNIFDRYYFTNIEIGSGIYTGGIEGLPGTYGVQFNVKF